MRSGASVFGSMSFTWTVRVLPDVAGCCLCGSRRLGGLVVTDDLFFRHVRLRGGPADVRRCLLPLDHVAEGNAGIDERRAITTLLRPPRD
jgi:hypothetical protein